MLRFNALSLKRQLHNSIQANSLENKTALVTGASRGIGLAIAESFAMYGTKVILVSHNEDRAKQREADFISRFGSGHQSIAMDISKRSLVMEILKEKLKGVSVDYLVNAAGVSRDGLLVQLKEEDIQDTINTNLVGTMTVSQCIAKGMMRKRSGCIINIASAVGIQGNSGQSVYTASKAGVIGFTKALAKELGPVNVRVNCIAPGFIETDMTNGISDGKKEELIKNKISLRRFGSTQDIADAAMFIAKANYLHGHQRFFIFIFKLSNYHRNPFDDPSQPDLRLDSQQSRTGDFVPPGADMNPFADEEDAIGYSNSAQHQGASPWAPSSSQRGQTTHYGGNDLIDFQDQYGNSQSTNIPAAQSAYTPGHPPLKHSDTFMTDGGSLYEDSSIPLDDDDNLQLLDHQGPIAGSRYNRAQPPSTPPTPGSLSNGIPLRSSQRPSSRPPPRGGRRQSIRGRINELLGRSPGVAPGQENEARTIYVNSSELNDQQNFLHNRIFTGKYTFVSFLPKFLYEEFSKYANLFFLFISGIQQIPGISPTSRWTTLVPLLIVLLITAVKEVIEDWGVHRSDAELNARACKVLEGPQFVERAWRDVKVGDILRIDGGGHFPADLILLSSSEPEGLCYIETSNLDGEVNLKIKQALPQTAKLVTPVDISQLQGTIKSEQPNNRLYNYDGTINLSVDEVGRARDFALDPTQLLLRGAQLRNTSWIYGIVVFTGHETKLMLNSSKKPSKVSNVTRITNRNILYLFAILVAMSIACSIGGLAITITKGNDLAYLALNNVSRASEFGYDILTFLILFNSFIPISLMVTMELVKYIQSYLIDADLDMYYEPTNTAATARSSSLIEELGQIQFVFSDKTGTLTCNEMQFRQSSIAGLSYADKVESDRQASDGVDDPNLQYTFTQLQEHLKSHSTANVINEFLTLLAVCHTVIPEKQEDTEEIIYQASSPDEGALVKGASTLGYTFHTRRPNSINCSIRGRDMEFQILNVCEFNSTRKRMSAVVRGPDGKIKLYCKGADTVILERLAESNPFVEPTLLHLEEYATEGLRTLCVAMREIPEDEYARWSQIYDKAATTLVNRSEELDRAAEMIEQDMFLLGATAIEDKLQDGVPDTIHTLQEAGIKVWVLTGDRQETAINIGYSCKLLNEEMSLIVCNEENHWDTKNFLEAKLKEINDVRSRGEDLEPLALIIDGRALTFALEKDIEKALFDLAVLCKAVVCCRVSPLQKALVVKLVKKYTPAILLAIGDGANDVSMIQAAHVGIGISGVEGLQAARSADFAISQFRYLKKLLLVHGAWSYHRLSKMIFYYFYKNVALYLTQFWYAFYNGFSGSTLYESWTMSCFNVIFTFLPPLAIGIFDQFVSARMLDKYPQLYILGQQNEFFNQKKFWGWFANAIFHSLILFFTGVGCFRNDGVFMNGTNGGQWWVGTVVFTAVLGCILWKGALITDIWTKYTFIAIPGSMAIWFLYLPIVAYIGPAISSTVFPEYTGIVPQVWGNVNFWLYLILVPFLCNLRDFAWKFAKRMYRPMPYHFVQEIQKFNLPDYRPRMDRFRQAVNKVRRIQRLKRNRGYAFSQTDSDQTKIIRVYDTTQQKPQG